MAEISECTEYEGNNQVLDTASPQSRNLKEVPGGFIDLDLESPEFSSMYPTSKISCSLMNRCLYGSICKKAHVESSRILSIPQTAQTAPEQLKVYSQSVFYETSEIYWKADWPLVGKGTKHVSCGTYWTKICTEDHSQMQLPETITHQKLIDGNCLKDGVFIQRVKMTCHRPSCPECWPDWRKRQVARVAARFKESEKDYNRQEKRHVKRCHGSISVPKELWYLSQPEMKKHALKYLKQVGITGGTIIYHPKRQRKKGNRLWYYSPHFHVYFHAWNGWINGTKVQQLYDKKGWVFRNFGERPLQKSISYQLSHAGVTPEHGHIVTWFGTMNYRLLHVEKYRGSPMKCPWGHKLDYYGVYVGKEKLQLPDRDGYLAYLPKEGWVKLPHRIRGHDPPEEEGEF